MLNCNSTIHIFGGTGFIGRHLCNTLLGKTDATIRLFSRRRNVSIPEPVKPVELVYGDMLSEESVEKFVTRNGIIVNLAHLSSESRDANLTAISNLADACIKNEAKRLIHCSTAVVVGKTQENSITEETECRPNSDYERIKLAVENLLIEKLKDKVELAILRPTAVFGEGGKNLVKTANELTLGSRITNTLKTSLFYKRRLNLVCVENVVAGLIFLSGTGNTWNGEQFIISDDDDDENTYYDTIALLSGYLGMKPPRTIYLPFRHLVMRILLAGLGRSNANIHRIYSSEKLVDIGFKKSIEYREGVKRFALWYSQTKMIDS